MRRIASIFSLVLLTTPALAADPSDHKPHMTWQEHFAQANLAHDGHLTLAEAKGGYAAIARHFDEIDSTHKGFVTEDDIKAWHATKRAAHQPMPPNAAEGQSHSSDEQRAPAGQRLIPARFVADHGEPPADGNPIKP